MPEMTSRERLLAAMRYQQPDYVPLVFNVFGLKPPAQLAWSNQYEETQRWLSLGVDATLTMGPSLTFHPDVTVRSWTENVPGERWPLAVNVYETPAGPLRQEVFLTDDWVADEWPEHKGGATNIRLAGDDYNVVRSRRFPVTGEADLEKLKYLLWPPSDAQIAEFHEHAAAVAAQARELGVIVETTASAGADMATWLCGVDGMLFMAMDQPEVFQALLDIIHARNKRIVEMALDTATDVVSRRAWYEGVSFWSPAMYRRFFQPQLAEIATMVHQADRLAGYTMSTGFMPLLDMLVECDYDVHYYIDPVMGGAGADLAKVKRAFNGKIAVEGGMNSAVTLEQGTTAEIRQAVFDGIATMAPGGGFILTPVDSITASTPWSSVETVIAAWKEARGAY
ncbi:MAG: uroporphyrinogen decarboxylase family protein [Anaerolineae bacterium]